MNLKELQDQFRGRKFGELVLHHYRKTDFQTIVVSLQGTIEKLPKEAQRITESWFDEIGSQGTDERFWQRDCGDALITITNAARRKLQAEGIKSSDDDLFNMFQIIVLNFVYGAYQYPESRFFIQKAIGIDCLRRAMRPYG